MRSDRRAPDILGLDRGDGPHRQRAGRGHDEDRELLREEAGGGAG